MPSLPSEQQESPVLSDEQCCESFAPRSKRCTAYSSWREIEEQPNSLCSLPIISDVGESSQSASERVSALNWSCLGILWWWQHPTCLVIKSRSSKCRQTYRVLPSSNGFEKSIYQLRTSQHINLLSPKLINYSTTIDGNAESLVCVASLQ